MASLLQHGSVNDSEVYWENNSMVGIAENIDIPELGWETFSHKTLGSVAILKKPSRALKELEGKLKIIFPEPQVYASMLNPNTIHPWQVHDKVDVPDDTSLLGADSYTMVTAMALTFSNVKADTKENNEQQSIEADFCCVRLRQTILASGEELFAVDVLGNTIRAGGENIW